MTGRAPAGAAVLQPHVTQAITDAVLQEWTDKGFARMSMETVAKRAGVGKGSLYRRWSSKQDMAMAVLKELRLTVPTDPDTGSLYGDLQALVRAMLAWLADPRIAPILADLVAQTTRDPDLGEAVETLLRSPFRSQAQAMFDRAITRGELSADADPEVILELVASIIYWRIIVRGQPVTDAYLHTVLTTIEYGFAPAAGPPSTVRSR